MSTIRNYKRDEINKKNEKFSALRTTIETVFYGNNVIYVRNLAQAYELAKNSSGTVVTGMDVYEPEKLDLPSDAKVLLYNDGEVTGRYAKARVILNNRDTDKEKTFSALAREAAFYARDKKLYYAQAYVGLHEDFMLKAHLLIQEGYENTLYNWLLNFQAVNEKYEEMYRNSKEWNETDIYVLSLPDYLPKEHEKGLALFEPSHNCLLLCGMRYFGEHKKGTLTLSWEVANRNGYVSCHGGLKRYNLEKEAYTIAFFGLSGSGKSTLTHDKHEDKFDISILHDDAFIISESDLSTVALEPSYFDKTQDYPAGHEANKYLLSIQNCGATLDENNKIVPVTEDIRNGNGRAIKSHLWTTNRINKVDDPLNAIVWLMRDSSIPPIIKIKNPVVASVFGAVLATKRTTAERLDNSAEMEKLVIVPYANPFRTYALSEDYEKFKNLFDKKEINCYIINTGSYMDKKIPKEITLGILEKLVEDSLDFKPLCCFDEIDYAEVEGFEVDCDNRNFDKMWKNALVYRMEYVKSLEGSPDELPTEVMKELEKLKSEVEEHARLATLKK